MSPPLRLEITLGDPPQHWLIEREGDRFVVGRSREAALRLPAPEVSGQHLQLTWQPDGWEVEDLGSANGSRLNRSALRPGVAHPFGPGDELTLAGYRLRLVTDPSASNDRDQAAWLRGEEGTASLAAQLVRELLVAEGTAQRPWLTITDPTGHTQRHSLPLGQRIRIGRHRDCELPLADPDLSREHGAVKVELAGVVYEDLGSKNGSFLGDERLTLSRQLADGDELRLGACRLRFSDPAQQWLASLDGELANEPRDTDDSNPASEASGARDQPPEPTRSAGLGYTILLGLGLGVMLAAAWGLWRLFRT